MQDLSISEGDFLQGQRREAGADDVNLHSPILQADKSLRLLAFLQNTLRSAADRINKSDFRGRYGTVNYHTVLNL